MTQSQNLRMMIEGDYLLFVYVDGQWKKADLKEYENTIARMGRDAIQPGGLFLTIHSDLVFGKKMAVRAILKTDDVRRSCRGDHELLRVALSESSIQQTS